MICLGWLLLEKVFEKKIMLYWDWTYASWLPLQCKPLVPLYVPFMEVLSGVGLPQHCFWPIHCSICIVFMEGPLCMNNWKAQSKNDPLIFRPFLKVFRSSWILACGHFQKWPKNQGIVLALSPPITYISDKM